MGVKVHRNKNVAQGKYYLNLKYSNKGKIKYEPLNEFLWIKATTQQQKLHNRKVKASIAIILEEERARFLKDRFNVLQPISDIGIISYMEMVKKNKTTKSTWNSSISLLNKYLKADVPIRHFKESDIDDICRFYKSQVSQSSAALYLCCVKHAFKIAHRSGDIQKNPAENISLKFESQEKFKFLTIEELRAFSKIEHRRNDIRDAYVFSALTGLRISDIRLFNINNVNYDKSLGGYTYQFKQKKTHSIFIPIPLEAYNLIPESRDFSSLPCTHIINTIVREIASEAGIRKYITFHSSRHTFGTMHITHGTDIYTLKELMGHKNIDTTMVYAKVVDKKKMEAVHNIPKL